VKRFLTVTLLMGGLVATGVSNAAMTVNISESGGNVTASFSGSINTAALTSSPQTFQNILYPQGAFVVMGEQGSNALTSTNNRFTGISGPTSWGSGGSAGQPNAWTGDIFAVYGAGPDILLPTGYTSGNSISGSSTWSGSLSSLGLTSGTYTYTWGTGGTADTLTVNIGSAPSSVPTLSEWAQLVLALMTITLVGWHFHRERSY
jgi:hypothetical protein